MDGIKKTSPIDKENANFGLERKISKTSLIKNNKPPLVDSKNFS
jgi:hypothetical protein